MSDITLNTAAAGSPEAVPRQPPTTVVGPVAWLRTNLFSSWWSTAVTLALIYLIVRWAIGFVDWAFVNAVWSVPDNQTQACRAVQGTGACWAVVTEKYRFILFATYPYDEQWRPALVCLLFIGLYIVSAMRRFWRWELAVVWVATLAVIALLMWGGVPGLTYVPQERWGGLPITLILSTFGIAVAFPLSILVALGRRSSMPAIRLLCIVYVELIRGVPLISLLFMASVMFPLFLPEGMNIDKLLRAQIAITLFAGAYLAEVVRGGLQAIPKGQVEAAAALGLGYWKTMALIVLPQALKLVIPGIVNTFIALFKDTSLVLIIGLFDLMNIVHSATTNPAWLGFSTEGYVFAAAVYWLFCFSMSHYSQSLEKRLHTGHKR